MMRKPSLIRLRTTGIAKSLSASRTARKAVLGLSSLGTGRRIPAASWLLAKAASKLRSMPMTSPVERISGPKSTSTPPNFTKGKTASLTAMCLGTTSLIPISRRVLPAEILAATLARGTPMTFDTNGTVREARGFTSRMKMPRPSRGTANCTFIKPRTSSSRASARDCSLMASMVAAGSEKGGSAQAESPEWMPASSMCSITPPIIAS